MEEFDTTGEDDPVGLFIEDLKLVSEDGEKVITASIKNTGAISRIPIDEKWHEVKLVHTEAWDNPPTSVCNTLYIDGKKWDWWDVEKMLSDKDLIEYFYYEATGLV